MKLIVIPRQEPHMPENPEPPDALLEKALQLALPMSPVPRRRLKSTMSRTLTRRATFFLGQTCNLRCHFCYYLDRIEDRSHPEHEFMPLQKAKAICKTLVEVYGNNAVDIQGGEPTIYPHILPLVQYCNEIGLRPTLITNALILDREERVLEYERAGIGDFLVSVHGLGTVYDTVVGMEGAHVRQMRALRNLAEAGIPFRFNTVMTKASLVHLPQIARLAVRTGAEVVNFLAFNPFGDQVHAGAYNAYNVPRYSEVSEPLTAALDILAAAGVEANVRYFPFCMLPERHRKSVYNHLQLHYDHHEHDFVSTGWTAHPSQRTAVGEIAEPPRLQAKPAKLELGRLRWLLRRLLANLPRLRRALTRLEQTLATTLAKWGVCSADPRVVYIQEKLAEGGGWRRGSGWGRGPEPSYTYGKKCFDCDVKEICDGCHADYAVMFGTDEVQSIKLGYKLTDPTFYIHRQSKVVEPQDEPWAMEER